jgi:thiol-disulfide isomerase/thioredoxin
MTQSRRFAATIGLAALLCAAGCRGSATEPSTPTPRDAALREAEARDAASQVASVAFADLAALRGALAARRGRRVLVNFWATWCVPCVEELPDLAALSREYAVGEAEFLGVSLDAWVTGDGAEAEEKVRRSLITAGVGYANLIYRGDQDPLMEAFAFSGPIPHSVLFDRDGRPVRRWEGKVDIAELRQALAESR